MSNCVICNKIISFCITVCDNTECIFIYSEYEKELDKFHEEQRKFLTELQNKYFSKDYLNNYED